MTDDDKIEVAVCMAKCGASADAIKAAIRDMERQDNSHLVSWGNNKERGE